MSSYEISQIDIRPNDYQGANAALCSNLGCWNFFEVAPANSHLEAEAPIRLCVLTGSGLLDGKHALQPGTVVDVHRPAVLDFTQTQGIRLRYQFPQNMVVREKLEALCREMGLRSVSRKTSKGFWTRVEGLEGVTEELLMFCYQPGPLHGWVFSRPEKARCLNLSQITCYTFEGLKQDSAILKDAKLAIQLSERFSDLGNEELFLKRSGKWYRWTPSEHGSELPDANAACKNQDELVERILSQLWQDPDPLCRWMNTAPFHQTQYRVPFLHLPEGWSVSSEFQERWQVQGVCSQPEVSLAIADLLVTVCSKQIQWCCNSAREMASWDYRIHPVNKSVSLTLLEVYD